MSRHLWVPALAVAACTSSAGPRPLGMNDVTMLIPLPQNPGVPVLGAMTDGGDGGLVQHTLFEQLAPPEVTQPYGAFQIVAVRFDLCDRTAVGPCVPGSDGQMRLVFQPLNAYSPTTDDVALHAAYPIPSADVPSMIAELRSLAELDVTPQGSALGIDAALGWSSPSPDYATRLRALVMEYANPFVMQRLTLFAVENAAVSDEWVFRGVELDGDNYQPMMIVGTGTAEQIVQSTGYKLSPVLPDGTIETTYATSTTPNAALTQPLPPPATPFELALSADAFMTASTNARLDALAAVNAAQNPAMNSLATQACVACHVSTVVTSERTLLAGVAAASVPDRYTSSAHDLALTSPESTLDPDCLRMLGYKDAEPAISQRVVNETAELLDEIEARYPE